MIRNLLATTAIAGLLATSAYAQENAPATTAAPAAQEAAPAAGGQNAPLTEVSGHLASNMIGETVYNGTGENAENIGEVNDLVVSAEGQIENLVIGVGGFLGIGERDVAVEFDQAKWADRNGDRLLVVEMTREQLEGMQPFDKSQYEPAPAVAADGTQQGGTDATGAGGTTAGGTVAGGQAATDTTQQPAADQTATAPAADTATTDTAAQQPAQTDTQAAQNAPATGTDQNAAASTDQNAAAGTNQNAGTDTTQTAAIDRSQLTEVPNGEIRADDIVGTTVYGANDANLGEIGDVVLTADGKVDAYLVDVGGFLGMGEKEVAISAEKLSFLQDANGNKYLYTNFSQEQLEAQPAYDEGSYAQNRDQQRLSVQQ